MNNKPEKKISLTIGVALLLFFIASIPVSAASYNKIEGFGESVFNLDADFSSFEMQEAKQKQAKEQVKNNYQLVLELAKKKQYEEANIKIKALIEKNPKQSIYYNLKALMQLFDNNFPGAEQSFLKAIELNPESSQAYTGLAKLALDNKQFILARKYANKLLEIDPYQTKAYQVLASVAMQQQGIDKVEALLLDGFGKVKNNIQAEIAILHLLKKVYIRKNQPQKLFQLAKDLTERNKEDISAYSFFAEAQLLNKNERGAEKTLRQIIVHQPDNSKYLFLLARLLSKQKGKESEILGLLDKAAANMDNPALVLSYKTAVLIRQKNYKQAFSIAQRIDESNPAQNLGKILKADIYFAEKKYKKAFKSYQQAYLITPNIKVLDAMLKILTVQNKPEDAVILLEKEYAKNKANVAIQFRIAVAYQNTGQYVLSSKYYEAVLDKQKDNVIVLNNLAWIYSLQNNSKAIKLAERAWNLALGSGAVADTYGYILLKNGNNQESLRVLKRAVKLSPKLTKIQLHLAEAYIANQEKSLALGILQQLVNTKAAEKEEAQQLMKNL